MTEVHGDLHVISSALDYKLPVGRVVANAAAMVALWFFLTTAIALNEAAGAPPEEVVVSCGAVGREFELCREGVQTWGADHPNIKARVVEAPAASGERLGLYQLMLAAHSSDIDVFLVDTTWPGMIGDFFIDLRPFLAGAPQYFSAFIENNTIRGRLTAIPWFIDAGLLYYRKDLLARYDAQVPKTWTELTKIATEVQTAERRAGHTRFWGFVFQGRAYEGLMCNALEWVASFGGGSFVANNGQVTIDNDAAYRALLTASEWVGKISPPGVVGYIEEDARAVFQSGDALFMRNWPYAWNLAQAPDSPVRGKVGFSVLPTGGGGHVATLGGWSLAVSRYSKHPHEAVELALFLTSAREQKRRARVAGLYPTIPALYRDEELRRANPDLARLLPVFESAAPRPSRVTGGKYNRASGEISDRVHRMLETRGDPAIVRRELHELGVTLNRIGRDGKW